jgi:hypothetical protein
MAVWQDDVDVGTDVALRFDQVEELVNRDDKLLTKPEKAGTYTIGGWMGGSAVG